TKALTFYQRFLNAYYYDERFLGSSYYDPAGSASSLVFKLLPILTLSRQILVFLLSGGFAIAGAFVLRFWDKINHTRIDTTAGRGQAIAPTMIQRSQTPIPGRGQAIAPTMTQRSQTPIPGRGQAIAPTMDASCHGRGDGLSSLCTFFAQFHNWWTSLRADPSRCGLVVL